MIDGPVVNADLGQHIVVNSKALGWITTDYEGIYCKIFERIVEPGLSRETCLFKLNPSASFPKISLDERAEIFVVYGKLSDGEQEIGKCTYHRIPPNSEFELSSESGCVIFFRRREGCGGGIKFTVDAKEPANFQPCGGRGSEKIPLEDPTEPSVGAWIGRMKPDMHIPNYDHVNGEEIFVLEGIIEDEHAIVGPGSWVRFPVGFRHSPFSQNNEVLMLVREGDVKI